MAKGMVFDIEKFAVHDGPGIRTTVFLKGCPLHCIWCHNPESWRKKPEILFSQEKCSGCGNCAAVCPQKCHIQEKDRHVFRRRKCNGCGACASACPMKALEICGRWMTPESILEEILKDRVFYENSGGGMTLSGGEPMMQFDFSHALLKSAHTAGLHICMETCGFAPLEEYWKILPFTNLFLFDIKSLNAEKHQKFTGVPLEPILKTLEFLNRSGAKIVLRCPLIPGLNDSDEELAGIGRLAEKLETVSEVNVEPYHPLGKSKALRLGISDFYSAPFAGEEFTAHCIVTIQKLTSKKVRK